MGTFKDSYERYNEFKNGLQPVIVESIQNNGSEAVEFIREQLYSGVDGDEKVLSPSYSSDPFFQSPEAGHWKNNGKGYAKWKKTIQPPSPSYLGFGPRNMDTPNLIIVGNFYESIKSTLIENGIHIHSTGVHFARDIESKYGDVIYKLSPRAKKFFWDYTLKAVYKSYISKFK